jgi:hypothetical protein
LIDRLGKCRADHHCQHLLGVQPHIDRWRRLTQGSLCNQPRTLWTKSNVLWTHQLTGHLPDHDRHHLSWTNCEGNPHSLYGRHSNPYQAETEWVREATPSNDTKG